VRHARRRRGPVVTSPGSLALELAWYRCDACGTGFSPCDRVLREAGRRRLFDAGCRVVPGSGAPWIRDLADGHVPDAVRILDIWHARQHILDVARAVYGKGTDLAEEWGKARRDDLDAGRLDRVMSGIRRHADSCEEAAGNVNYFETSHTHMDYPRFRARGLCVSTGVVEGGCRSVIGGRLKNGMHWSVDGSNAIIALRCAVRGNRLDDFRERRAV